MSTPTAQSVSSTIAAGTNLAYTLGTGGSGAQVAMQLPALGASVVGMAASAHVGWATAAIPFIGPIVAGVTLGLGALFSSRQRGKQKVAATQIVDQAEPLLRDNVDGYLANPTPEAQRQALGNFDYVWQQITSSEMCGSPQLGTAGQRCIAERAPGGKWDWFALYRDPIANTPPTLPTARPTSTLVQQVDPVTGETVTVSVPMDEPPINPLLIVAIAAAAYLAFK
jgi:hypothetical protein